MEGGGTPGSAARRVMHLADEAERQTAHAAHEAPGEAAAAEAQRGAPATICNGGCNRRYPGCNPM